MSKIPLADDVALWHSYVEAADKFRLARKKLLSKCGYDAGNIIVEIVRRALNTPDEKYLALDTAELLTVEAKKQLFADLFQKAVEFETTYSYNKAEQIILSLPKEWLKKKLAEVAEFILESDEPKISSELLGIYFEVDKSMARKLAAKALASSDESSRDVGMFFLKKLNESEDSA